jgi:tetratricopeptide (TPR) repeat protein
MESRSVELFEMEGVQAALAYLRETPHPSPAAQVQAYDQLARHVYWQNKDLHATIEILQAGLEFGESLLDDHPDEAVEIKSQLKAIHYNLASFTWVGWDEPGFTVTPEQEKLGLKAAQANLQLATELKKEDLPLSRAYWMLAAQEISARQYEKAKEHFSLAEQLAKQAGVSGEELLAHGFLQFTELLIDPGNEIIAARLADTKTVLQNEEHGEIFVQQLETAGKVFGG